MSNFKSEEQAKHEEINAMGEPLGELYHHLWQELSWLYSKWHEYVELFGTKPSRIELMNQTSPYFFSIIHDVFWENILLGIAKLTDASKTFGKKENLTIRKIPELLKQEKLKKELMPLLEEVEEKTKFAKDWRNRKLAHFDYLLIIKKETKNLEIASREKVREALASIAKVLNMISKEFLNYTTAFTLSAGAIGGVKNLLYYLNNGKIAVKEKEERI